MKIFSAAFGPHDHNTYDGRWHNQLERHTRLKHNVPWHFDSYPHHSTADKMNQDDNGAGIKFYNEYWKPDDHEIFAFTTTIGGVKQMPELEKIKPHIDWYPENLWDYKMIADNIYYIDHHQSHAAYAYISSGYEEADILAVDGRGWKYNCIFIDKNGNITDLSKYMNIGTMWNWFAKNLGFGHLGASKVMGLAGYGAYDDAFAQILDWYWQNDMKQPSGRPMEWRAKDLDLNQFRPEDIAHTLQQMTEEKIRDHVYDLKSCDNICVAGGVGYNGYINQMLHENWKSVFVPPAPGDEGQALGTYMHADYTLNKNKHRPSVYIGKEYKYKGEEKVRIKEIAQAIADGKIVGWFQGKSESGHRALGNRSILADPRNPNIKEIINSTIKNREDFRPFAPSVLEEHYMEWFDASEPSPYMSKIVKTHISKRRLIPGVVHVDGTSRIQTVNAEQNKLFHYLINEFYKITGVPMLLNTSFNCQEPIVETPEEAINTFNKTDMDLLVINDYILHKMG